MITFFVGVERSVCASVGGCLILNKGFLICGPDIVRVRTRHLTIIKEIII
jgi:hypothetical protein